LMAARNSLDRRIVIWAFNSGMPIRSDKSIESTRSKESVLQ
jgi:hypothetical protein